MLDVLAAVGVVTYDWDIASDELRWGGDAAAILKVPPETISTGGGFATQVDANGPPGRSGVIVNTDSADDGEGVEYHLEYRLVAVPDQPGLWVEDCGRWYAGSDGRPARAHGLMRIITERRARDDRLVQQSECDDLTGGLNRFRLIEELETAIKTAIRYRASMAFSVVAVDELAVLNNAYGFDIADEVIAEVAARIGKEMRAGDSIGRLAGNRVGIVLSRCTERDLRTAARRFVRAVSASPIVTRSGPVAVSISVGGVVLPRHGRNKDEALTHAQEALHVARGRGYAGIVVHEPSPVSEAARVSNAAIAFQIVSALKEGHTSLAFQPVVSALDSGIRFHEALSRLNLDDGTQLTASNFIGTAERLGIIRLVDFSALDLAVAELIADPDLSLSVNVSASSVLESSWLTRMTELLRSRPDVCRRLIVEITETVAIHDIDRAIAFVRAVRGLGCRVAIDDFGTGHTSFRNLRGLGVDIVKIDGSFIERISENEDDRYFVTTLVSLAQRIGLVTVAERVANEKDAQILRDLGVDYLQGNLFGEPQALPRPGAGHSPKL